MQANHWNLILQEENSAGLYLGDYASASDLAFIKKQNIKTVLTVASELIVNYPAEMGISHFSLPVADTEKTNISQFFAQAIREIDHGLSKGGVLGTSFKSHQQVHCAAGVSRSATIVLAYIMEKRSMNFQKALLFVKMKRYVINPNRGFVNSLILFESKRNQPSLQHTMPVPRAPRQTQQNYYAPPKIYPQGEYGFFAPISQRKQSNYTPQKEQPFYKAITKSLSSSRKESLNRSIQKKS